MLKKLVSLFLIPVLSLSLVTNSYALNLARVKTWAAGEILTAADLNAEFNNILNHSLTNNDISAAAAIQASKIDFTVSSAIGSTTPSTGAFTTLSATGDVTLGNGTGDNMILNFPDGITFTPAATWTFTAAQTVSGTWTNLGVVTTVDINGGTLDGVTIGGASAGAATFTSLTATGDLDIGSYELRAQTLESDVATGTAPFTVASTTKVTNLNADYLDGMDSSEIGYKQLFTTTGANTFTSGAGVTTVYFTAVGGGAGGAGGGGGGAGGAGGGGGFLSKRPITVTASTNYTVTVGTGGAGGAGNASGGGSAGGNGVDTTFSTLATAKGGLGGVPAGAGGLGGGTPVAQTAGIGYQGVAGVATGGGGGGSPFGNGGNGVTSSAGNDGTGYGSGGGGGALGNNKGGAGTQGMGLVEW